MHICWSQDDKYNDEADAVDLFKEFHYSKKKNATPL